MTDEKNGLAYRLRSWVGLTEAKRSLEADLRRLQKQLDELEPTLLEDMALAGMQSASVDGMTVYNQREFTCALRPEVDKAEVFARWLAGGHWNLVVLGWTALRAYVKELAEAGEPLPEEVSAAVEVGQVFRLRARKN